MGTGREDRRARGATVDDVDRRIMAHLRANSRIPYKVVARDVGLSETAVRHRIARMLRDGVFALTIYSDTKALGLVTADLHLRVAGGELRRVAAEVAALPEVEFLAVCSGPDNLAASVVCTSQEHLVTTAETVRAVAGVERLDLRLHLDIVKSSMEWQGLPGDAEAGDAGR